MPVASFVVCGMGGQKKGRGIETPSLLFYLWVLSADINHGELKLVSILIRDAVLLGQECTTRIPAAGLWEGIG